MMRGILAIAAIACAVAVAAIGVAGASAALPEYTECQKVKNTGAYKDNGCTIVDPQHKGSNEIGVPAHRCGKVAKVEGAFHGAFDDRHCTEADPNHEGSFELTEGVGKGKPFKGKASGGVQLQLHQFFTGEERSIICSKGSDEGLVTGPSSIENLRFKLQGCEGPWFQLSEECSQVGASTPRGTIEFGPLSATLGYISSAEHRVGIDLKGEGEEFAEVYCEFAPFYLRFTGSDVAQLGGEQLTSFSKSFELDLSAAEGLEGQAPDVPFYEIGSRSEELGSPTPLGIIGHFSEKGVALKLNA
jgi:hypothetical protein